MAISKRLRYEILRRDNHTCRYCGGTAPQARLTVDHVTPSALGGCDLPDNLVTACGDCNAGKSSMPADAALVDDVRQDAIRWARAIKVAQEIREADETRHQLDVGRFCDAWERWDPRLADLPKGFQSSIRQFRDAGLTIGEITEAVDIAFGAVFHRKAWRYFCGVCWTKVRALNNVAAALIKTETE